MTRGRDPLDPRDAEPRLEDVGDPGVEIERRLRRSRDPEPVPEFTDPAPVVTDSGVYGTLPSQSPRLQDFEVHERPTRSRLSRVAGMVLALSAGAWLLFFSVAQVTGETVALPAIERTLDQLLGLEELVTFHEDAIRNASDDPVAIPGFDVEGVTLTRAEATDATEGDPEQWRALLRERSARAVYQDGVGVLFPDGDDSDIGTFSTAGGVRVLLTTLSQANHQQATVVLWPAAVITLVALVVVLLLGGPFGRFQTVGFALAIAALPTIALALFSLALIYFIGSDGSPIAQTAHNVALELPDIPLRNGITVFLAGLAIAIPARIVAAIYHAFVRRDPALEYSPD